jgi:mycothiol synthase
VDDPAAPLSQIPPADRLRWAVLGPHTDEEMSAEGLHRVRTLVELRRTLPVEPELAAGLPTITTRAFRPGADEAGFLEVNNAAFWWHPEQGDWDRVRLGEELHLDWVHPSGILVHEGPDGRLDGFCWTRIHPADDLMVATEDDPDLGEIYAIAAHPNRHGTGLGSALVLAGLDHLHREGLGIAILYTEEANDAARSMYDRLGFHLHERRGGYR